MRRRCSSVNTEPPSKDGRCAFERSNSASSRYILTAGEPLSSSRLAVVSGLETSLQGANATLGAGKPPAYTLWYHNLRGRATISGVRHSRHELQSGARHPAAADESTKNWQDGGRTAHLGRGERAGGSAPLCSLALRGDWSGLQSLSCDEVQPMPTSSWRAIVRGRGALAISEAATAAIVVAAAAGVRARGCRDASARSSSPRLHLCSLLLPGWGFCSPVPALPEETPAGAREPSRRELYR